MTKPKGEIWFLASCVELYKDAKGLNGCEAYNYLRQTDAVDFIVKCWDGLHITSPAYIIDSIDEYITNHAPTKGELHNNDKRAIEFVAFCIEMQARDFELSGTKVCKRFEKFGVLDYLFSNYEALHTQGWGYIKDVINDFTEEQRENETVSR